LSTCNNNSSQTSDVPVQPIRDTVYMEVVKTIVDTLTITKSDTVSFVDSTINTTYEMVSLPNVQFYTNSRVLLPSSVSDLQKLAEYLIKNADLTATIFGHTDNVGNPEVNLKLSQERAESVKQFLMNLGIESKRLNAVGMGASKPKGDNSTEEGRMLNRRVEVKLVESEKTETIRTQSQNPINN
jgi:outer membrane protein OmpA-like peptidoglycan-associated protein